MKNIPWALAGVCLLSTLVAIQGEHVALELETRVRTLEKQGLEQGRIISSLMGRVQRQETTIQIQSKTLKQQRYALNRQEKQIHAQSQTLKKHEKVLNRQVEKIEAQAQLLDKQQQLLNRQGDKIHTLSQLLQKRNPLVHHTAVDTDGSRSKLHHIKKAGKQNHDKMLGYVKRQSLSSPSELDDLTHVPDMAIPRSGEPVSKSALPAEGPVAFHATIDRGEVANLGVNQKIVFDSVHVNLGDAYSSTQGLFITKVKGVYIFSVSISSYVDSHPQFSVALKKDGTVLARVFGHGDNGRADQGSVTVVSQLDVGNMIWVDLERPNDDSIYGGRYTSFMGCLINRM